MVDVFLLRKGYIPAAGSPTATLLRLHLNYFPDRENPQKRNGSMTITRDCIDSNPMDRFGQRKFSGCDGRYVQGLGTNSPWHADPRLLAIPASCSRVAENNPN